MVKSFIIFFLQMNEEQLFFALCLFTLGLICASIHNGFSLIVILLIYLLGILGIFVLHFIVDVETDEDILNRIVNPNDPNDNN